MAAQIKKIFPLLILVLALAAQGGFSAVNNPSDEPVIRIAILKNIDSFIIIGRGDFEVSDAKSSKVFKKGRRIQKSRVKGYESGIYIGEEFYPSKNLRIKADKDIIITSNEKKKKYRNIIDVIVQPDKKLMVLNVIDVEGYIKGVLYHEVTDRWPMEAMKAQAVAARTYAFYQISKNKAQSFDVTNDIYSQVYGGKSSEKFRTTLAVERTANQIMVYKGEVLPAYYSSNCGGHTENVNELWKYTDLSPLKGIVCKYCQRAPNNRWKVNLRLKDIQDKLNKKGYELWLIKDIEVVSLNDSGRIKQLKITDRKDKEFLVSGKDFRDIIGPNIIKSNMYDVKVAGYFVDFVGSGWGHGVGMCQWGAFFMAQEKFKYDEILKYYYPGADIASDKDFFNQL